MPEKHAGLREPSLQKGVGRIDAEVGVRKEKMKNGFLLPGRVGEGKMKGSEYALTPLFKVSYERPFLRRRGKERPGRANGGWKMQKEEGQGKDFTKGQVVGKRTKARNTFLDLDGGRVGSGGGDGKKVLGGEVQKGLTGPGPLDYYSTGKNRNVGTNLQGEVAQLAPRPGERESQRLEKTGKQGEKELTFLLKRRR